MYTRHTPGRQEDTAAVRKMSVVLLQPGELVLSSPSRQPSPLLLPSPNQTAVVLPFKRSSISAGPAPGLLPAAAAPGANKRRRRRPPRGQPVTVTSVIVEDPRRGNRASVQESFAKHEDSSPIIFNPDAIKRNDF